MRRSRQSVDKEDVRIAQILLGDRDAKAEFIAAEIGLSLPAVYKRLQRMRTNGILGYEVKLTRFVFPLRFVSFIHVDLHAIQSNSDPRCPYHDVRGMTCFLKYKLLGGKPTQSFLDRIFIEDCFALMGSPAADIVLFIAAHDRSDVFDFITSTVGGLPGIRDCSTVDVILADEVRYNQKSAQEDLPGRFSGTTGQ